MNVSSFVLRFKIENWKTVKFTNYGLKLYLNSFVGDGVALEPGLHIPSRLGKNIFKCQEKGNKNKIQNE